MFSLHAQRVSRTVTYYLVSSNHIAERRYNTTSFYSLGQQIGQGNLSDLLRRFLYCQEHPEDDYDPGTLDLNQCPSISQATNISVFHSARVIFCAPSNPCGTGGMYREVIRSTPVWKKGEITAPRRDCIFVAQGDSEPQDGFRGLNVARVYLFFSFELDAVTYSCALVQWFSVFGEEADPDTGMWVVTPDQDAHGYRNCSIIHLDSIVRGAHLLAVFGPNFVPQTLNYTQTLDAFAAFYVNKFADHHSHDIAF